MSFIVDEIDSLSVVIQVVESKKISYRVKQSNELLSIYHLMFTPLAGNNQCKQI